MSGSGVFVWPALDVRGQELPAQLVYRRGLWGKVHGSAGDFEWIAHSFERSPAETHVENELAVGGEDAPTVSHLWRSLGALHYAVSCSPSRAVDAAGRSGFLEKQVVEWRRPDAVPAALGALLLLPHVAGFAEAVFWDGSDDAAWRDEWRRHGIGAGDQLPVSLAVEPLTARVEAGIQALLDVVPAELLSRAYAALLAGSRGVPLGRLARALAPEAVACLLLPLPRDDADRLSVAGWVPSQRLGARRLADTWDLVAAGNVPELPEPDATPTAEQQARARLMVQALQERNPALLLGGGAQPQAPAGFAPVDIAVWGPAQTGKTALMAQLYLQAEHEDWEVLVTPEAKAFVENMRRTLRRLHEFPTATALTYEEKIVYGLRHRRNQAQAWLHVEDRGGGAYSALTDTVRERLREADGLVLLLDPLRDVRTLESEVWSTLEAIQMARQQGLEKDPRPIAVCVSKADLLIRSPEDLAAARSDPDGFVRERVPGIESVLPALKRYCEIYQFFPCSAAGVWLRYGSVEPVLFFDEDLKPRLRPDGRTFNLIEPFAWLVEQVITRRRA